MGAAEWVDVNGELHPAAADALAAGERAFLAGDGAYDTLKAVHGRCIWLDDHLDRLEGTLDLLGIQRPCTRPEWRRRVLRLLRANRLDLTTARVRLTVSRGPLGGGAQLVSQPSTSVITAQRIPPRNGLPDPISARTLAPRRVPGDLLYRLKTTSLAATVLAQRTLAGTGCPEGFALNTREEVCEGLFGNVFAVTGGTLLTPPLESPCLPGIVRQAVLALAQEIGIRAEETPIPRAFLAAADEVFTTSSVRGIVPVGRLDGFPIGNGRAGRLTRRLAEAILRAGSRTRIRPGEPREEG